MSNCIFISAVDPDPTHPSTTVYNPQLLIGVGGGLGGGGVQTTCVLITQQHQKYFGVRAVFCHTLL